jgi:hypothetical protein
VVIGMHDTTTTETERTQRLHREDVTAGVSKWFNGSRECIPVDASNDTV